MSAKMLSEYYETFFPSSSMFDWINQGKVDQALAARREYCVTLNVAPPGAPTEEVFCRYKQCRTKDDLKALMMKRPPQLLLLPRLTWEWVCPSHRHYGSGQ